MVHSSRDGGRGLWTTPPDLARFAIELQQAYAGKSKKVLCGEIIRGIAREYGWVDYLAEKIIVPVDVSKLGGYVGDYEFNGTRYSIMIEDGKLKARNANGVKLDLLAESETKFFLRERPVEFVFVKDASGRVSGLILEQQRTRASL